jgi:hypothetical protein
MLLRDGALPVVARLPLRQAELGPHMIASSPPNLGQFETTNDRSGKKVCDYKNEIYDNKNGSV